jgi:hypothetical protein
VAIYSHHCSRVCARIRRAPPTPPLLFRMQIQAFADPVAVVAITWHITCDGEGVDLQPATRRPR